MNVTLTRLGKANSRILLFLVGLVFFGGGVLVGGHGLSLVIAIHQERQAAVAVSGTVIRTYVGKGRKAAFPVVVYRFTPPGTDTPRTSERTAIGGENHTSTGVDEARALLAAYQPGAPLTVYVMPNDPERSFVIRTPFIGAHAMVCFSLPCLMAGLALLWYACRGDSATYPRHTGTVFLTTAWGIVTLTWIHFLSLGGSFDEPTVVALLFTLLFLGIGTGMWLTAWWRRHPKRRRRQRRTAVANSQDG